MKGKFYSTVLLLWVTIAAHAQITVQTMVPQAPVAVGESFRVQYVVHNTERISRIFPMRTPGFRLVTGPETYPGRSQLQGRSVSTQNIAFTLEPLATGTYSIPGITIDIDGVLFTASAAVVKVVTATEAAAWKVRNAGTPADNPSFLRPGEDPYQKIKDNLFVKVSVDRDKCVPGQPVVATFKLYSRLQSQSDIIKYPAFYGFAVQDMIDLSDRVMDDEEVNGRMYNVHTMRQVQLYPLSAGDYLIDEMRISNRVAFSKNTVNGKTEQEITEGVLGGDNDKPADPDAINYNYEIVTRPVRIKVNPLPAAGKPADFTGAVGTFAIETTVSANQLDRNQEGVLEIKISGRGNFNQLTAPALQWPQGMETFQTQVKDELNAKTSPLSGAKVFRIPFVAAEEGNYLVPASTFSYYDPDSNKYISVKTKPVSIHVTGRVHRVEKVKEGEVHSSITDTNRKASIIAGGIILLGVLVALIYWLWPRRKKPTPAEETDAAPEMALPAATEVLEPVYAVLEEPDAVFYTALQKAIWAFFQPRFSFSALRVNKAELLAALRAGGKDNAEFFYTTLEFCEQVIYTGVQPGKDRVQWLGVIRDEMEKL